MSTPVGWTVTGEDSYGVETMIQSWLNGYRCGDKDTIVVEMIQSWLNGYRCGDKDSIVVEMIQSWLNRYRCGDIDTHSDDVVRCEYGVHRAFSTQNQYDHP
jgi:ribosome modulation factor